VQKVYGILTAQLLVTVAIAGAIMHFGRDWMKHNQHVMLPLVFASMAVSIGMMCVFMCCPMVMRQFPLNYILLGLFTVAESVMVGFICLGYTQESVIIALVITAVVVVSLSLFACQTSYDFTGCGPYLFCAVMCLMGLGLAMSIASMCGATGPAFHTMRMVMAAGGALIFSMYIVYDTQLIIGGKHQNAFSIDDYAAAAISLYIDIIQLFLYLLQLFGSRSD